MTHTQEKKQTTETIAKRDQMSDFTDKDVKVATIHMFKELKGTTLKEENYDDNISPNKEY